jgi:NAD(P)H-dependent FMN reductase
MAAVGTQEAPSGAAVSVPRSPIRLLVFSASLRAASYNTQLARLAASVITRLGGTVDHASMSDFECSAYDEDRQNRDGMSAGAEELRRRIDANDAFVIASPEYNASMPGHLKNAIDWTSRFRPQPFNEKQALLLSASPSMVGGNRGLWSLRIPLEHLGARVYPDMFSLAQAHKAFKDDGELVDAQLGLRLERLLHGFLDLVEAARHYPCAKKAWFEFLGEHPEGVTERAE